MFDAKKLLDQVLSGVQSQAGGLQRPGESLGDTAKRYLEQGASGSGLSGLSGQGGGLATGALAGGVIGLLLGSKKSRKTVGKLGGSAVKLGGLALVAGLAYKAWTSYQQQQQQQGASAPTAAPARGPGLLEPPRESPFHPAAGPGGADARAADFLVAMISAAKADGHIDPEEQARIFGRLEDFGLDDSARAFVMDEVRAPLDVERIVRMASTPAVAAELYAASLLAMDPDTPAERAYLDLLAARLGLDRSLAAEIERAAEAAAAEA